MNTITVKRPALHHLVVSAIRRLAENGLTPTPEHVLWMQDAALRIKKQSSDRIASMIDWPVQCGGVNLYPLSFAALEWLRRLDDELQLNPLVQAFACAHSHDRATLMNILDRTNIVKVVREWKAGIISSPQALTAALNVVLGTEGAEDVEIECQTPRKENNSVSRSEAIEYGAFVLSLCSRFPGTSPEYWTWEVSMDYALSALNSCIEQDRDLVSGQEITAHIKFRSIVVQIEKELIQAKQDAKASTTTEGIQS